MGLTMVAGVFLDYTQRRCTHKHLGSRGLLVHEGAVCLSSLSAHDTIHSRCRRTGRDVGARKSLER